MCIFGYHLPHSSSLKSMVAAVVFACYLRSDTRVSLCAHVQGYWQGCRLGLVPLGLWIQARCSISPVHTAYIYQVIAAEPSLVHVVAIAS